MSLLIYPDGTNSMGGYGTNIPKGRSLICPNKKPISNMLIIGVVAAIGLFLVVRK